MYKTALLIVVLAFSNIASAVLIAAKLPEREVIAYTLWLEARSQGKKGLESVATVIYNRAKRRKMTFKAVCLQPKQFSCWNAKRVRINSKESKTLFTYCFKLADKLIAGKFRPTGPWNMYFNPSKCHPSWAHTLKNRVAVKDHLFGCL